MADYNADIDPGAHRVLADASRVAVLETLRRAGRPMAIPELAAQVGLHPNTVRAHLALLTEHGHVTGAPEDRTRPGRPRLLYTAVTRPGDDNEQRGYRLLAEALISYLGGRDEERGVAAVAAGRAFGERAIHKQADRPDGPDRPGGSGEQSGRAGDGGGSGDGAGGGDAAAAGAQSTATGDLSGIDPDIAIERVVGLLQDAGFEPKHAQGETSIELHRCPFRELAVEDPEVVCGVHLGMMQGALHELGAPVEATRLLPFVEPNLCIATLHPTADSYDRAGLGDDDPAQAEGAGGAGGTGGVS